MQLILPRGTIKVAYQTLARLKLEYPFGALTRDIRLRMFRGQRPARPVGDGETQAVSTECLMSLNGHLLRPVGISPLCFSFTVFILEQCLLKETSTWPLLTV